MNSRFLPACAASLLLVACHSTSPVLLPRGPGSAGPRPAEAAVILSLHDPAPTGVSPDPIALPADYYLMLVDGRLVLVRDAADRATLHLSAGEPTSAMAQTRLAPQEVAAAANRERAEADRLEAVLQAVLHRAAELEHEAEILGSQSRQVAAALAARLPTPAAAPPENR